MVRLRQEMSDEGHPVSSLPFSDMVLEEIARARYMRIHEGLAPVYGALISEGALPEGLPTKAGDDQSAMRSFADGISAVLARRNSDSDHVELAAIDLRDELSAIKLCESTSGVLVQRDSSGTIVVTTSSTILLNEGFQWRSRPVARLKMPVLSQVLKLGRIHMQSTFADLLDFAFHLLAPAHIGATLVVDMTGDTTGLVRSLSEQGGKLPFLLNLRNPEDCRTFATYLRMVDGACLIGSEGHVTRTQVMLDSSAGTSAIVEAEHDHGLRHATAKWFSFDHPETVVIVVSADGPVTLYSCGVRIAAFEGEVPRILSPLEISHDQMSGLTVGESIRKCAKCGQDLQIDYSMHAVANSAKTISCPICGNELEDMIAVQVSIIPFKPWFDRSAYDSARLQP